MHGTTTWLRFPLFFAGAALALAACDPAPDRAAADSSLPGPGELAAEHAPDSVLVRFRAGASSSIRSRSFELVAGTVQDRDADGVDDRFIEIADGQLALVQLADGVDVADALAELRSSADVLYAEPNYIVRANRTPNDPRFPELWGLHNIGQTGGAPDSDIDAPEAWDTTIGRRTVIVGVVDTGIDHRHQDLAANMWINPSEIAGNGVDDDGNGFVDDVHGVNAITSAGDSLDDNGHGSHVAGTIGAVGNNGVGVTGVSWRVRLMALKFLSASGSGTLADAIEVINYAVTQKKRGHNLRVLSNSWGGGAFSQALLDAITAANKHGILFVATAGGSGTNNDITPAYPASYEAPNVVAVTATDDEDLKASFANFGATSVDLGAPGVGILSTTLNNTYSVFSGTSMATPHVAGAAALVLSVAPTLNNAALIDILLDTGDPVPSLQGITVSGRRLNVASAVAAASAR